RANKLFVHRSFSIIRKSCRHIRALHSEEHLAFLDKIPEPRLDFDDSACRNRNHRHIARNVRSHHPGRSQFRQRLVLGGGDERELLRVGYSYDAYVLLMLDLRRRRSLCLRIALGLRAARGKQAKAEKKCNRLGLQGIHWMTSRPAARFTWLAALR